MKPVVDHIQALGYKVDDAKRLQIMRIIIERRINHGRAVTGLTYISMASFFANSIAPDVTPQNGLSLLGGISSEN